MLQNDEGAVSRRHCRQYRNDNVTHQHDQRSPEGLDGARRDSHTSLLIIGKCWRRMVGTTLQIRGRVRRRVMGCWHQGGAQVNYAFCDSPSSPSYSFHLHAHRNEATHHCVRTVVRASKLVLSCLLIRRADQSFNLLVKIVVIFQTIEGMIS